MEPWTDGLMGARDLEIRTLANLTNLELRGWSLD